MCTSVRPASVLAAPAEVPFIAAEQHATGVVSVAVDIDARGRLRSASLIDGSGNRWFDGAALKAARVSRYTAEAQNCERVGGAYAFIVDYTGD